MNTFSLQDAKQFLLKKFNLVPQIAIITGSGIKLFGNCNPSFEEKYDDLHLEPVTLAQPTKGHEGKLKLYKVSNKNILVFSGRHHLYEGLDIADVVTNVRLSYELGVRKIIVTNAAGGISKRFKAGDLMLIKGFINLMQPTERGILSGIIQEPKLIKAKLTNLILRKFKGKIKTGIYVGTRGPTYETYSEINLFRALGAHAVGMSTIPEMICAKSLGLDFAGISVISNTWDKNHKPCHEEVLQNVKKANSKLNALVLKLVNYM